MNAGGVPNTCKSNGVVLEISSEIGILDLVADG